MKMFKFLQAIRIFHLFLVLLTLDRGDSVPSQSLPRNQNVYFAARSKLKEDEKDMALGGSLVLNHNERAANNLLMAAKHAELDAGFKDESLFFPAHNFLIARDGIKKSAVYKMIQKMPKGAVLHVHDKAMVSTDFLFYNITFQPNLYVCEKNDIYQFKFMAAPGKDCSWEKLEDLRQSDMNEDGEVDRKLHNQLSMLAQYPYIDAEEAWAKLEDVFDKVYPLVTYRPTFELYIYQGLQELYDDNVMYAEIRTSFSTLTELHGTSYTMLDVVRIYKDIIDRFIRDHPDFLGVKFIYSKHRNLSPEKLKQYVENVKLIKEAYPNLLAGFDLIGQEDRGDPLVDYADELRRIGNDIPFFFHAGETNWNGYSTDENLIDAVLLNTKRIGHGYALLKHPKVMELVKQKKIGVEVNPISNQVLMLVEDMRNHPASYLFAENFPIVVSNDDPGFWGAKALSFDFYEAFIGIMSRNADLRALKKLAMNSIAYSSMNSEEKSRAFDVFHRRWNVFVNNLNHSVHNGYERLKELEMELLETTESSRIICP